MFWLYFSLLLLSFSSSCPFVLSPGSRGVKLLVRCGIGNVGGLAARLTGRWLSACRVRPYWGGYVCLAVRACRLAVSLLARLTCLGLLFAPAGLLFVRAADSIGCFGSAARACRPGFLQCCFVRGLFRCLLNVQVAAGCILC